MKDRNTPPNITDLKPNEIFVFGSNEAGDHAGGAARLAVEKFGAVMNAPIGLQNQSYAIPTLSVKRKQLPIYPEPGCTGGTISDYVTGFIEQAKYYQDKVFMVTEIGCGIAGFTPGQIAPLFMEAVNMENIFLPESFREELKLILAFERSFGKLENGFYKGSLDLRSYAHPLPSTFTGCGGDLYLSSYAHPLPSTFTGCGGDLYLRSYAHPLPSTFTGCGGDLYLRSYAHPLPSTFTGCGGDLYLRSYAHPLPSTFTGCGGDLYLSSYAHPLPSTFTGCGGDLYLSSYAHPLPSTFTGCGGDLYLRSYAHPLPSTFTGCGGSLDLSSYAHPLPSTFTGCGGSLDLRSYAHPLPSTFTGCGGDLYLRSYAHPLPSTFTGCGGSLYLRSYAHPLPSTFTGCGGDLYLSSYAHPLPSTFTGCGGSLDLRSYAHPLPSTFTGCGGSLDLRSYAHPLPSTFTGCGGSLDLRSYAHPLPSTFEKGKYNNHICRFDFELKSVVFLPKKFEDPVGLITAYKKVKRWGLPVIITLLIPAEARRCHGGTNRKCRAEYADVQAITIIGTNITIEAVTNTAYKPHLEYKVGERVTPDRYDHDSSTECSHGINYFLSKVEAEKY